MYLVRYAPLSNGLDIVRKTLVKHEITAIARPEERPQARPPPMIMRQAGPVPLPA
jgi:hypothetical protein